jgi:hypothetical protein
MLCEHRTESFASIESSPIPSEKRRLKEMAIAGTFAFASTAAMFGWICALGWLAYKLILS